MNLSLNPWIIQSFPTIPKTEMWIYLWISMFRQSLQESEEHRQQKCEHVIKSQYVTHQFENHNNHNNRYVNLSLNPWIIQSFPTIPKTEMWIYLWISMFRQSLQESQEPRQQKYEHVINLNITHQFKNHNNPNNR